MNVKQLLALYLFLAPMMAHADSPRANCSIADQAVKISSDVRGLKPKQPVPCKMRSRSEVENYLRETIQKKIPREHLDREGKVYQLLGIVPLGYDYFNQLIQLYTEQLGGYYDPDLHYYAMADWMDADLQLPIAVHEMTHALQDQYFNLANFVRYERDSGDTLLAKTALVEGDATAVMLDFERTMKGSPSIAQEAAGSLFMYSGIASMMSSPGLIKYPMALRSMLIFPYVSGFNFVHALLRQGGFSEVSKAFQNPPTSTEEILHPEIYLNKKKGYETVAAPLLPRELASKFRGPTYSDVYGEFFISTMLASWLPVNEASGAAHGWAGDRIVYFEQDGSDLGLILWDIAWDDLESGKQFFDAFVKAYEQRFDKPAKREGNSATFSETSVGPVSIFLDGKHIKITIGR